ncbi:hypothetical protein Bccel_1267 [Pseudobacteroides cellulosolvens ATCC 35603 = DSM 2933]|uniref:Uncharacterized protein n=2 Tax=Pseudobacteroides cellulosolvens TaxID=35825 RepID=A0A0L6JJT4_9FIRM|nr:hypothetical protein Bccel_1267 [Pseudobacteroides cellulosolvens ATCC 35603 = DSM 2933]
MRYTAVFMLFASKSVPITIDTDNDFRGFHDRMWAGEIDLTNDENKLQYALVYMNEFLSNINTERFENSLRIVSLNQETPGSY